MDKEKISQTQEGDASSVYVIAAIVVVALAVGAIMLWPKIKGQKTAVTTAPVQQTVEEKKPITGLTCDKQWFNPVIGYSKYYLSAEGADVSATTTECTFTVSQDKNMIATETASAIFTAAPERNGSTFRCTTKAVELPKGGTFTLITTVKNGDEKSAACTPGSILLQ